MIYVLSDIHGQKRRFNSIMKQIDLQPEDTLYVLGDVIDRNPDGIRILRQIMAMPNAKMLLGNHELMMLQALYYPAPDVDKWSRHCYLERKQTIWYNNGGHVTHSYLKHIRKTLRQEIFEFLDSLPLNYEITVNDQSFILVHAAPASLYKVTDFKYDNEQDFAVWKRYECFPPIEGKTVICGHTPTHHFTGESPMSIFQSNGWIDIDCGCMLPEDGDPWYGIRGRLSCLRLDDMKVFYSEEKTDDQ